LRKRIKEMKKISEATTFDELLEIKYGKLGTPARDEFEQKSKAFIIGEMIKEARKQAHLTQDDLAEKIGTKKSYISRIENGKIDIQISTLFKIFEEGLGRKLGISVL
jgi:DNA-binding XRE family transcriptional regulator